MSVDEWRSGIVSSQIVEAFACGTAAVITPIGRLKWRGGELPIGEGDTIGPVVTEFRECLLDIQYGRLSDNHGRVHRLRMSQPRPAVSHSFAPRRGL